MIDIHSHILYGIDDGSSSKEESIELLKRQKELGFTGIILTPHYIENTKYNATVDQKKELIKELEKETDVKLYIGNEVYFSDKTIDLFKNGMISTLNDSRYLLIELPMSSKLKDLDELLFDLMLHNVIPIIAHPERYLYVQDDIKYLDHLKELGVLFQSNYGSLVGKYGKKVEKTVKKLLKKNYITFIGTDIHHINHPIDIEKAMKILKKTVKKQEIVDNLVENNIQKVIDNKDI